MNNQIITTNNTDSTNEITKISGKKFNIREKMLTSSNYLQSLKYGEPIKSMDQNKDKNQINKYIQNAIKSWEEYNNSHGKIKDNSEFHYNKMELIIKKYIGYINYQTGLQITNIKIQYSGLYPDFIIFWNNQTKTETNNDNFFKVISGFWDVNFLMSHPNNLEYNKQLNKWESIPKTIKEISNELENNLKYLEGLEYLNIKKN